MMKHAHKLSALVRMAAIVALVGVGGDVIYAAAHTTEMKVSGLYDTPNQPDVWSRY